MKEKNENHFQVLYLLFRWHAVDCLKEYQKLKVLSTFHLKSRICLVEVPMNTSRQEWIFSIRDLVVRWKICSFDDVEDLIKSIRIIINVNTRSILVKDQNGEIYDSSGVYQALMLHFLKGLTLFVGEDAGRIFLAVGLLNFFGEIFSLCGLIIF